MASSKTGMRDHTRRRPRPALEAELAPAREALARSQQLSAVGELSAGIAHDLRNTLGGVLLRLELLISDASCTADQHQSILLIEAVLRDALEALTRLQDIAR